MADPTAPPAISRQRPGTDLATFSVFENGRIAHEHVWWDQASLLVQVGLLASANLAVVGVEQAKKLMRIVQKDVK